MNCLEINNSDELMLAKLLKWFFNALGRRVTYTQTIKKQPH